MHGGLSPDLQTLEQLKKIVRPTEIPDDGLLCDLLWSDPDKMANGWGENERGVSVTFSPQIVEEFLEKHDLDLVCRAHQVVENGYEFFANRQLVTLFSDTASRSTKAGIIETIVSCCLAASVSILL